MLLGLAIWSSEFLWANRLMQRFKLALHHFRLLPRRRQLLYWCAFLVACGAVGYGYMLTLGPPRWLPMDLEALLRRLPGV